MLEPPLTHNQLKPSRKIAGLKPETQHTCFSFPQWNKNYNKSRPLCECRAGKARRLRYQPRSVASWIPPRAFERLSVIFTFTFTARWPTGTLKEHSHILYVQNVSVYSQSQLIIPIPKHARHLIILDLCNRWRCEMGFILQILSPLPN